MNDVEVVATITGLPVVLPPIVLVDEVLLAPITTPANVESAEADESLLLLVAVEAGAAVTTILKV